MVVMMMLVYPTSVIGESWNDKNWETEVVDSFGGLSTNSGLSVAMDSQGRPHIAYYALRGADLRYAIRDGGSWSVETVDDYQVVGPDCSIALDPDDNPHICYYDKTNEELEYASRNGTGWDVETVDSLGIVGVGTAVAVTSDGEVYLAYVGARALRTAHREADGWNVTVLDEVEGHVYAPSMTVDHQGVPHILYMGAGTIKHAYQADGNWTLETVDTLMGSTAAMGTSICVDPSGDLVACFASFAATSVVVARRSGDGWTSERVVDGHYLGDLDMVLDAEGEPCIAFIDMSFNNDMELVNTDVWYMERDGSEWSGGVVTGSSDHFGALLDIHMEGTGEPCLAVVDIGSVGTEADLVHFTGWTGEFIEAYTGDGPADEDDGTDDGPGASPSYTAILVVLFVAMVMVLLFYVFKKDVN